jgi:hypothetical protein
MPFRKKALWIEDLLTSADQSFALEQIKATGANSVCIRTNSPLLVDWIPGLKKMGLSVYGWRWPYVVPGYTHHAYAPEEAKFIADQFIPAGADGYIMDIESDDNGSAHDWDRKDVDVQKLASDFCKTIGDAAAKSAHPFTIGLTSHARGFSNYPDIPWKPFLQLSTVLFPQTYWKYYDDDKKACVPENGEPKTHNGLGTPAQAIENGYVDYSPMGKPIIPVAGELVCATADEIRTFVRLIEARAATEAHFYVSKAGISPDVLAAIAAIEVDKAAGA